MANYYQSAYKGKEIDESIGKVQDIFIKKTSVIPVEVGGTGQTTVQGIKDMLGLGEDQQGVTPISNGGTGATTAADARTNLGVPPTAHASTATTYGAASASSYGHAMASSTTPKVAGTATVGSETAKFARGDHVHPAQTSVTGNAGSATKLATARTIRTNLASTSTASFDGSANVTPGVTGTLPISNGGTGATTAADARTNLGITPENIGAAASEDHKAKMYTSVTQLGFTSGQATIEGVYSTLPDGSRLMAKGSEFAEDELPTIFVGVEIVRETNMIGWIYLYGKDGEKDYRMYLTSGGVPNGTWYEIYHEGNKPTPTDIGALAEDGTAAAATKLATARTIRTNLASTSTASFDGSANVTPGVTGTLPISNGGTGATTATDARTNLGITPENIGALPLTGGTMTGQIIRNVPGTAYVKGRDHAALRIPENTSATSFYPILSMKTQTGSWDVGAYNDTLKFTFAADEDYETPDVYTVGGATLTKEGDFIGNAATATKLATARTIRTNLASTSTASFDGSANITPGVTGTLPISNGGTGNTSGYIRTGLKSGTTVGDYATAEGYETTASGSYSHAEGYNTTASGSYSHAEGRGTTASDFYSHAEGQNTTASGLWSHAEGYNTTASGSYSHAEGRETTASREYSHAEGYNTTASGLWSHAEGVCTTANNFQHVSGKYNVSSSGPTGIESSTGDLFIIGRGTSDTARANAFRVSSAGEVYGAGAYHSSGADYAEYFEWQDGNPNAEDRRGLFVALDGDKILIAQSPNDYVIGVISGNPCVLGDTYDDTWQGMELTDVFGARQTEQVTVPASTDENGQEIPEHTEIRFILNPDYDPTQTYLPRSERKEWAAVGLFGKLTVIDDGTCTVNGFCQPSSGGSATASDSGYRVMKRLDENHIQILVK